MTKPRGRITAQLDHHDISTRLELIDLINQNIKPPTPVTASDIYIRAMFIVSDEINAYGGRFPSDEHSRLTELLIDSPVLVGHRRDLLPIGRTFHAACLERDGRQWIKSYFYWLRSADSADTLRDNIDAGIYKECSIGFIYALPECAICGKDIRICQHEPLQTYSVNSESQRCHFNYRQIERVLETSLVYRGATPDTSITRDLAIRKSTGQPEPVSLSTLADLPAADRYLVTPRYDGIDILLERTPTGWHATRADERPIRLSLADLALDTPEIPTRYARLVGYRGKERCSTNELERFLANSASPVTRATLYVIPLSESESLPLADPRRPMTTRLIRSRFVTRPEMADTVASLATKDGVEIRPLGATSRHDYCIFNSADLHAIGNHSVTLARIERSTDWLLDIRSDSHRQFIIHQFDPARFRRSARFLADALTPPLNLPIDQRQLLSWNMPRLVRAEEGILIETGEKPPVNLRIRPIRLDGKPRYLFYQV
jgi:hypothetical protein